MRNNFRPDPRQNRSSLGDSYENFDLNQDIGFADLIYEVELSKRRLEALQDYLAKCSIVKEELSSDSRANLSSSVQSASDRVIEERPISPARKRKLQSALKLRMSERELERRSENRIRKRIATFLVSSFLAITLLSASMTWLAAVNPNGVNGQLIKDWTGTMVTADVGFISAILGYYFGVINRSRKHGDGDDDSPPD